MNALPPCKRRSNTTSPSFPLHFHLLDIIVTTQEAARANGVYSKDIPDPVSNEEETEVFVYLTGVKQDGLSVCVEVSGFRPYLYFSIPQQWRLTDVQAFVAVFQEHVHVELERRWPFFGYQQEKQQYAKLQFPTIKAYQIFASNFKNQENRMRSIRRARSKMRNAHVLLDTRKEAFRVHMRTFDFSLFFQIATGITVSNWVTLLEAEESLRPFSSTTFNLVCTTEDVVPNNNGMSGCAPITILSFDIESYSPSHPKDSHVPSNHVINIGMELSTYPGKDPPIRIVLCLGQALPSQDPDTYFVCFDDEGALLTGFREMIQHYDVDVITGYNIFNFDYRYMCDRWERMTKMRWLSEHQWEVYDRKSDIRLYKKHTYQIKGKDGNSKDVNFDHSYGTYEEYKTAYAYFSNLSTTFAYCGKLLVDECKLTVKILNTAAYGDNEMRRFDKPGRPEVDMWMHIKNNFQLNIPYKLESVSQHFLGVGKIDLPYLKMFALYEEGTPEALHEIAKYCAKDCDLPLALFYKLNILENANEMAVVCSTKISDIFTRGQGIKAYNLICRYSLKEGYVVNKLKMVKPEYVGATVLEPIPGYHINPVATLDFKSLYPSIMRAHNFCYSTLVVDRNKQPSARIHTRFGKATYSGRSKYNNTTYYGATLGWGKVFMPSSEYRKCNLVNDYTACGEEIRFVSNRVRKGILPQILESLLNQREIAKREKKNATDPFMKNIQNGRQLALKVACNSIYGFTGVKQGALPCWKIAAATTKVGRKMIDDSKEICEAANPTGLLCIYGDTDSVMIKCTKLPGTMEGVKECFRFGDTLAEILTAYFGKQTNTTGIIVMEMEKVCLPFINWPAKKRYVINYWEHPDDESHIEAKGVQMKRRDGAPILVELWQQLVSNVMALKEGIKSREQLGEESGNILDNMLRRIQDNEVPLEGYTISKSLRSDYKNNNLPHVAVSDKIKRRVASGEITRDIPKAGDRIAYVVVEGKKKSKQFERAEDPDWVKSHKECNVDRVYYVKTLWKGSKDMWKYFGDFDAKFQRTINALQRKRDGNQSITNFFALTNKRQAPRPLEKPRTQKKVKKTKNILDFFAAAKTPC